MLTAADKNSDYLKKQTSRIFILGSLFFVCFSSISFAAEKQVDRSFEDSIIVNGDTVEYSVDAREVTATGNVVINYKGTKLSCYRVSVNTQTKDANAEGKVRIEDERGVIEGTKIIYNFQNKTGIIFDAQFRSYPYFGKAPKMQKLSDKEFVGYNGYATTCNLAQPHYRIKSKKINMFPQDKIQTKQDVFYLGKVPLVYLPWYSHSLKEPILHMQIMPGKSRDWGPYLLTATRYNLTPNISGRIYFDYRDKLGVAEGFGLNYTTARYGKGDLKYYYTQERPHDLAESSPAEFQRYLVRLRHKWNLDQRTDFTLEYYKITDSKRMVLGTQYNLLKDYFFREYEKDSQPSSYALLHHNFSHSTLDFLMQKRTNRWYTQLEKLPEIKYSLPSLKVGASPFYFENASSAANFNYKYAVPSDSTNDISLLRFDTTNKLSLPQRMAFIKLTPFVSSRQTFYDKDVYGSSILPRTIFYSGMDASTKFYRIFNTQPNFLRMDIQGLRHIITPTIAYTYNHSPTIPSSKLKQIDSVDAINKNNSLSLELSNKLQTKRKDQSVDMADFRINTSYIFKPDSGDKRGSNFSDFLFDLKLIPYSWLRFDGDATYKHSGNRSEPNYNHFSGANYDINFNFTGERSIGIGQRYQRKGARELTLSTDWRINPKWKFGVYERWQFRQTANTQKGLREQQYTLSRDLHCWVMDITYSVERDKGESIWFIFRLKAFPELEFTFNQSYHQPKSGSQSNP